jgi:hypothetical protein
MGMGIMKISINRANKIRNMLEGITFEFNTTLPLRTNNTKVQALEAAALAGRNLEEEFERSILIVGHIRTIRDLISKANDKCGITPIISEIADIERQLKHFKATSDAVNRTAYNQQKFSIEDFVAAVEHRDILTNNDPTKVPPPSIIPVDVSGVIRVEIPKRVKLLKLNLQELQEKRNSMNHSHTVELPAELVEFLKANSLLAA